ncbi:MAG: type I-E CRISPR-associated protein Cas7/Cse4/CasC [Pseudoclavibacter sp.]|nr:type I-E CRISPR-associated protein Cas7/Cse4/CasC [Pseudoclavibacter sp.]
MNTHEYLTVTSLVPLPWHNLNRDDRGLPKSLKEGGSTRGLLSPQALKRAARIAFESLALDAPSIRSAELDEQAVRDAAALAAERGAPFDEAKATKQAQMAINSFVHSEKKTGQKDTIIWLSSEEYGALVDSLVESQGERAEIPSAENRTTSSLAIAAFGRMMAAKQTNNVDAAVSVGPAVTTHPITIEIDYFTAVDDAKMHRGDSAGAAHLGQSYYTSGVYARSFTIDRRQLRRNWTGWDAPEAQERLRAFLRSLLLSLPRGKSTNTAAASLPAIAIAETQSYRFTYQFHDPVRRDDESGYLDGSVRTLLEQARRAREFDPDAVGQTMVAATIELPELPIDARTGGLDAVVDFMLQWTCDA